MEEQGVLPVGHQPPVLHRAGIEIREANLVWGWRGIPSAPLTACWTIFPPAVGTSTQCPGHPQHPPDFGSGYAVL